MAGNALWLLRSFPNETTKINYQFLNEQQNVHGIIKMPPFHR